MPFKNKGNSKVVFAVLMRIHQMAQEKEPHQQNFVNGGIFGLLAYLVRKSYFEAKIFLLVILK